jgi:hypothetical protein
MALFRTLGGEGETLACPARWSKHPLGKPGSSSILEGSPSSGRSEHIKASEIRLKKKSINPLDRIKNGLYNSRRQPGLALTDPDTGATKICGLSSFLSREHLKGH